MLALAGFSAGAIADPSARVIVKLRDGTDLATTSVRQAQGLTVSSADRPMHQLGVRAGVTLSDGKQIAPRLHVALATGASAEAVAKTLSARSDVEYAVVDQWRQPQSVTVDDPYYALNNSLLTSGQWYLMNPTGGQVAAINAATAWSTTMGVSTISVAVVDTGVRFDHEDLSAKFESPGYNMVADTVRSGQSGRGPGADDYGDWLTTSEINSYPSIYSGCATQSSSSWHGTKVSGIIGAQTNNSLGMASVAPGVTILPVKAMAKCGGYDSEILLSMRWAAGLSGTGASASPTQVARVINLSLGGSGSCSQAYLDTLAELRSAKVVVVASVGNTYGQAVESPANCPGVVAVAGLRHTGTKVGYSSVGPEVGVGAPGGNCVNGSGACLYPILTSSNTGATTPVTNAAGGSKYTGSGSDATLGTSFSAPQASGVAALVLSVRPGLGSLAVGQLLRNTARTFPTSGGSSGISTCRAPSSSSTQDECYCTTATCGSGMLDAAAAVAGANGLIPVIDTGNGQPTAGSTVTLSGASSVATLGGYTIDQMTWTLVDGGGIVSALATGADSSQVLATPTAAGSFVVRLAARDTSGATATSDYRVVVTAVTSSSSSTTTATPSGGGGGGSIDPWSLLGLLALLVLAVSGRFTQAKAPNR